MKMLRKYLWLLTFSIFLPGIANNLYAQEVPTHRAAVRQVPDSVTQKMKRDPDFRYANDPSYWQKKPAESPGFWAKLMQSFGKSGIVRVLFYILIGGGIIFAVYQVMVANNFFFVSPRKRNKKDGKGDSEINEWTDFDEKILEETRNGNYRGAVRYMYLKTLHILSENRLITLNAKSTNQDYVRQLIQHSSVGQFRQLTYIYEYVWYGEFDPNEGQFERIRSSFNQFNPRS